MVTIKSFANDVLDAFNILEGSLAIQRSVTDGLFVDRDRIESELSLTKTILEDQLQYSRRNMVLVHGLDEIDHENTDDLVLKIFKDIDVNISKNKISRSMAVLIAWVERKNLTHRKIRKIAQ